MTDIHDLRAQMREGRTVRPVVASGGGLRIPFGLLAGAAVVAGFLLVLFTPKIYSVQRTAALPAFKEARQEVAPLAAVAAQPAAAAAHPPAAAAPPAVPVKSDYAGKSADEAARIADAVCEQRLASAPQRGQAAVEAKLHCFLTEGTARFCTGGQARKATADIINYFKGIEYTNTAMIVAAKMPGPLRPPSVDTAQPPTPLTPDARVAEAIEGLMRAGYLNRGHREDIGANVPRAYKERFARIVGIKAPCPEPPWWAVWK
jgi:hypothetical protein